MRYEVVDGGGMSGWRIIYNRDVLTTAGAVAAANGGGATTDGIGADDGRDDGGAGDDDDDEYDVVVCHANVIRFFCLRALQLPPEAWLRLCTMNCSVTHVTISPDGKVSLRSLGDTGHLSVDEVTFGTYTGTNW